VKTLRFVVRHPAARRLTATVGLLCTLPLACVSILPALMLAPLVRLRPTVRARPARFAAFAITYIGTELSGLIWLAGYWIGPGRLGRIPADSITYQDKHYALLRRLLDRLFHAARRSFALHITPPVPGASVPGGPLIIASRHAGPGDSFLLAYALLTTVQRRPRFVLSQALTVDPLIGTLLRRTPNCFVALDPEQRHRSTAQITRLAEDLGPSDALVIFPEGRNFTTARRARLLRRLRQRRARLLPTARSLEHVLPAHSSGLFAAIDAAPADTHLVFLAHTGLDRIETARDAWRSVPLATPLQMTWWSVAGHEIPAEADERERWLARQWSRVDTWIDEHRPPALALEPEAEPGSGLEPGLDPEFEPEAEVTAGPDPLTP
jgi:1-acyl-sn-glycerol-3-phosphate acyltransferase